MVLTSSMRPGCRGEIAHLASVLTPNQFEAEQLVQQPVVTEADALRACRALHAKGPATVVRKSPSHAPVDPCMPCRPSNAHTRSHV